MRAILIAICLMLVAGCGGPDTVEPTARSASEPTTEQIAQSTPEPTATPDACETASQAAPSRQLASIAPIQDGNRTLATSWVYFEDIHQLAWASHLIVRGRVVADCGTDGESGQQTIPDLDMRMLVEIDALYRGQPRETILVPATSDGYSSDSAMLFEIGNKVILFLSQPQNDGAFPVGGPQGHWRVVDDRAFPNAGHYPSLPVDTFEQSLASAMHREPPTNAVGSVVSLAVAPLGPDLSDDREPPLACDGTVPPPGEYVERATDLVWLSERVIIGTVSDVHDSFYPDDPAMNIEPSLRVPVTDYVVHIEQHLRGAPVESVTVRQPGGTVDGCTVSVHGAPDPAVGDRLLLFLSPLDAGRTTYVTTTGQRGLWQIGSDGMLAANTAWQSHPQVVPTADVAGLVSTALAGTMPQDQWQDLGPVSLNVSPQGDSNWPALSTRDGWAAYDDPNGRILLDHPAGWTVTPATGDTVITLTSWQAGATDEAVPAGEVRIEIREMPGDRWFEDASSMPVSVRDQSGWLYFHSSHWPLDPTAPDQAHDITANYLHNGSAWEIKGTFGAQPTPDDPATIAFYTLLQSIRYAES